MVKRTVLAIATAACSAAGRPARHRATVWWPCNGGEVVMRRRIGLLVSLVALLALGGGTLAATPAWATPPQHFHQQINLSIPADDELSAACGFDVVIVLAGNVNTTLVYDPSGGGGLWHTSAP